MSANKINHSTKLECHGKQFWSENGHKRTENGSRKWLKGQVVKGILRNVFLFILYITD